MPRPPRPRCSVDSMRSPTPVLRSSSLAFDVSEATRRRCHDRPSSPPGHGNPRVDTRPGRRCRPGTSLSPATPARAIASCRQITASPLDRLGHPTISYAPRHTRLQIPGRNAHRNGSLRRAKRSSTKRSERCCKWGMTLAYASDSITRRKQLESGMCHARSMPNE